MAVSVFEIAQKYKEKGDLHAKNVGSLDKAEVMYKRAALAYRSLVKMNFKTYAPYLAECLASISYLYFFGDNESGLEETELEIKMIYERLCESDGRYLKNLAECYGELGMVYLNTGRKKESVEYYRAALKIFEQLGCREESCFCLQAIDDINCNAEDDVKSEE